MYGTRFTSNQPDPVQVANGQPTVSAHEDERIPRCWPLLLEKLTFELHPHPRLSVETLKLCPSLAEKVKDAAGPQHALQDECFQRHQEPSGWASGLENSEMSLSVNR